VAAYGPTFGPWPVLRASEEGDDAPLRTLSPPMRDAEAAISQHAASGETAWSGDGRFPLTGLSRSAGFAPLSGRGGECDVRRRLGPPVERPPREIPLTHARDPPAADDTRHLRRWMTRLHRYTSSLRLLPLRWTCPPRLFAIRLLRGVCMWRL